MLLLLLLLVVVVVVMMVAVVVAESSERQVGVMVRVDRSRFRRIGCLLGGLRGAQGPLRVGVSRLRGAARRVGCGLRPLRGRAGRLRRTGGGVGRALSVVSGALGVFCGSLCALDGIHSGAAA
jgi:hypothetical protein